MNRYEIEVTIRWTTEVDADHESEAAERALEEFWQTTPCDASEDTDVELLAEVATE